MFGARQDGGMNWCPLPHGLPQCWFAQNQFRIGCVITR